jgi:ankyrin repeat protein
MLANAFSKSDERRAHRNCLGMLFLTNAYDDRANLISTKGRRVDDTCQWIKGDVLFQSWLNPGSQLLWITGGPGKGKTMLSIFLTEELAELVKPLKETKLIFYFCDYQDEKRNTAITILKGLLFQILNECPKLFKSILQEFEIETKARYAISSFEALWRVFESVLRDPDFGTMYCVIDGLDECDEASLQILITKLSDFFRGYSSNPTAGELKLIAVSRELPQPITAKLSRFPRLKLDPDSDDQVNSDIKRFISAKVDELSVIEGFSTKFRAHIEKSLLERAEGTFLWVGFVTNELLQKDTCTEVVETREGLPKGLPGIYGRMLLQIKEDQRNTAVSILRWVVMALRPLTLAELAVAINARPASNLSTGQAIQDYVKSCGAFIKITKGRVDLVHQSARDYLIRQEPDNDLILEAFRIKQEEANLELARTCLEYIQIKAVSENLINVNDISHLRKFPLLDYAALYWPEHAGRCVDLGEELFDLSGPFFQKKSPLFQNWWIWYRSRPSASWKVREIYSLLHLASYLGIIPLARKLLVRKSWKEIFQKPENKKDSFGMTPLMYAAQYGHKTVLQLLLDSKADVSTKGNDGQTVLHQAARKGDEAVVQLLLDSRADVNAKDKCGQTALYLAAEKGREAVVQQLLDSKANVNARVNDGRTALHSAAIYGSEAVVLQLLYSKADVNAKDNDGETALYRAALHRREAVVAQLLYRKADVNAKDNNGVTALHVAAGAMNKAVVAQLLYSKADVNAKDNNGETALHWAAMNGYKGVVQQLLDSKADVNAKNNDGQAALHLAARSGYKGIVQKLLDSTADINAKNNYGETALHLAARYGNKAAVEQLIYSAADVNAKTINGQTALDLAAEEGHNAVMGLLKSALCL